MKKQTVLFLFGILALSADLSAQFGFNAGYRWNDSDNWVEQSASGNQSLDLLPNGYSIGVDYWFRLKNARVEFLPELNYSSFAQTFADDREINARFLSFFFNTNFYLFDFRSDCDCPTFSKQDHTLQKGFFIQVSPGLSYLSNKGLSFNQELQTYTLSANSLAFSIGAAGLPLRRMGKSRRIHRGRPQPKHQGHRHQHPAIPRRHTPRPALRSLRL